MLRDFFHAIDSLFTDFLFAPMHFFRALELKSWWAANLVNWIFFIICCVGILYWMKQLNIYKENNDDNQDTTAHSFLK